MGIFDSWKPQTNPFDNGIIRAVNNSISGVIDAAKSNWSGANDAGPPRTSGIAVGAGSMPAINFGPSPSSPEWKSSFADSLATLPGFGTPAPKYEKPLNLDIKPGTITDNDIGADVALRNRTMGDAARFAQFNPMMLQLERQRQLMIDRRNAAIGAAGRGAGAPYNAAINRLNDEIAKLQEQMPRVGDLFEQKIQNQYDIYGRAAKELGTSYDEALAYKDTIDEEAERGIRESYTQAQNNTADFIENIGADKATALAVAGEVGYLEDEIMNMNEVNAQGIQAIMQASENLAVKAAVSAGADNALDLKRKQIEVESDMKEKLNSMIEDRKQQIAARNAAVAAARALEAARWPQGQPLSREGFQSVSVQGFFKKKGISPTAAQFGADLVEAGMSSGEFRKFLNGIQNGKMNTTSQQIAAKYDIDPAAYFEIPASVRSQFGTVAQGLEIYYESGNSYNQEFAGADPRDYNDGTAGKAMAGYNYLKDKGFSDEDAFHFGREIADTPNEQLDYLDQFGPVPGSKGYGDTVTGSSIAAGQWRNFGGDR